MKYDFFCNCLLFDFRHCFEIQNRFVVEQVAICERGHDRPDRFLFVDQSSGHDVHLLLLQVVGGVGHPQQLDQTLLVVDGAHLFAQDFVQDFGDGKCERKCQQHEEFGQPLSETYN